MKAKLKETIESGEILNVWYFGGETPGSKRDIFPIVILDDKVRAKCMKTDIVKIYSIEKMELYIAGKPSELAKKQSLPLCDFESISDILNFSNDTLQSEGWIVKGDNEHITLHLAFKNGKVKKKPVVQLRFDEFEYIYPEPDLNSPDFNGVFWENVDLDSLEKKKRTRPWIVSAKDKGTITYGKSNKAFSRFLEWAYELSPIEKI